MVRATTVAAAAFALLLLASSASAGRHLRGAGAPSASAGRQLLQIDTVELGTAGDFAILAKTGITTVPDSVITGDIGVSPITFAAMTGFSPIADSSATFYTSAQVTGQLFGADLIAPTPTKMTAAISDLEAAYTDAAGRPNTDGARINLGAGTLGVSGAESAPLTAGVYTWSTDVTVTANIWLSGSDTEVFIFQTTGDLKMADNLSVTLSGGALAKNIFWQVAGAVTVGAGAHFEGNILAKVAVTFVTGSSLNGRILSQTAVHLQKAVITKPAQVTSGGN
jgi:hypothetical protein